MHQSTPCLHCGKPVPTFKSGKPRKYCDKHCCWKAKEARYAKEHGHPRRKTRHARGIAVCKWCESEFVVLWTGHTTCSRECSQLVASWGTPQAKLAHTECKLDAERLRIEAERKRIESLLPVVYTGTIGRQWEPTHTHGTGVFVQGTCVVCGDPFTAYKNQVTRTCSPKCCGAWEWSRKRKSRQRRADLARVAFVEYVDPYVVYARDEYKCHLCGGDMVMNAGGYHHLMPSLDHVVPISRGGKHSYANVKAAHHMCNSRKGPALYGQYAMTDDELEALDVA